MLRIRLGHTYSMDDNCCRDWHIGDDSPEIDPHDVIEVQANGEELKYIAGMFEDIPWVVNTKTTHWFGDHAKFIVGNLVR